MRVLRDESMSRFSVPLLTGHEVRTARQVGWAGLENDALLSEAVAAGFDVLVTADRGIEHQQDVARVGFSVVVPVARSNRIQDHVPLAGHVTAALATLLPGEAACVPAR